MTPTAHSFSDSVDPREVEQFSRLSEEWWEEDGKFALLHRINPLRVSFIRDQMVRRFAKEITTARPFEGISLLDIGCGGGLIAEPMARLGARVTGVDASKKNIRTASLHAETSGLDITYRHGTAEQLAHEAVQFDVVLALEIIEHVVSPGAFLDACAALVKPGGLLVVSTINRTLKSLLLAKIGAEYLLRWVPPGTHHWQKFLLPSEIESVLRRDGLHLLELTGMPFHPLSNQWSLSKHDIGVNYLMGFGKLEREGSTV